MLAIPRSKEAAAHENSAQALSRAVGSLVSLSRIAVEGTGLQVGEPGRRAGRLERPTSPGSHRPPAGQPAPLHFTPRPHRPADSPPPPPPAACPSLQATHGAVQELLAAERHLAQTQASLAGLAAQVAKLRQSTDSITSSATKLPSLQRTLAAALDTAAAAGGGAAGPGAEAPLEPQALRPPAPPEQQQAEGEAEGEGQAVEGPPAQQRQQLGQQQLGEQHQQEREQVAGERQHGQPG